MLRNEEIVLKKGMDCLSKNLGIVEIEMFISAITKSAYDYTGWRQEYFEKSYKDREHSQLENFLNSAAKNDPHKVSYGLEQ
ncbi:MAG: hypothetical protein FWG70_03385 [Oscillospiraceae bacterium]|nr:hypothetical protein [Oscillospiraceae bacterium]